MVISQMAKEVRGRGIIGLEWAFRVPIDCLHSIDTYILLAYMHRLPYLLTSTLWSVGERNQISLDLYRVSTVEWLSLHYLLLLPFVLFSQ